MSTPILKKTIFISFLGHIAVFGIFGFSFGVKVPCVNSASVSFFGEILRSYDLISRRVFSDYGRRNIQEALNTKQVIPQLDKAKEEHAFIFAHYLKPQANLIFNGNKIGFTKALTSGLYITKRKEPVIMFYPPLPYHVGLYFKDRQTVHIELMFNIISSDKTDSIAVKRKISSGNLEADLLVMRYINHYLFIQQASFPPHSWQTVKIDLSAKDGK